MKVIREREYFQLGVKAFLHLLGEGEVEKSCTVTEVARDEWGKIVKNI